MKGRTTELDRPRIYNKVRLWAHPTYRNLLLQFTKRLCEKEFCSHLYSLLTKEIPMPLMKPSAEATRNVLVESGLLTPAPSRKSRISGILTEKGLGLDEIADNLLYLSNNAENEQTKVKVNELALKLHGELDKDTSAPEISINFTGVDAAMIQVLIPRSA